MKQPYHEQPSEAHGPYAAGHLMYGGLDSRVREMVCKHPGCPTTYVSAPNAKYCPVHQAERKKIIQRRADRNYRRRLKLRLLEETKP